MRAREVTVEQLFSGNVTLVSPSFQRPYAWVRGACANVLAACRGDDTQLFQRAVVTMDIAEGGDARKELLIDGNHRITTVLATLLAVRDALGRLDPSAVSPINAACFLSVDEDRHWRFKHIVHKKDRGTFESLDVAFDGASIDELHASCTAFTSRSDSLGWVDDITVNGARVHNSSGYWSPASLCAIVIDDKNSDGI